MILAALLLNKPIVLIWLFKPVSPKAKMVCGVLACGNKVAVALLTLLSVACADNTTAISNSKGVLKLSSVVGLGMASARRSNIAKRVCLFMSGAGKRFFWHLGIIFPLPEQEAAEWGIYKKCPDYKAASAITLFHAGTCEFVRTFCWQGEREVTSRIAEGNCVVAKRCGEQAEVKKQPVG